MLEKRLYAIPAQSFTANGTTDGLITLAGDVCRFKVKQQVFLSATSLPNLELEVKRVISDTQLAVGPCGGSIDVRTDISAYTVVLGATIAANEQKRPSIPYEEVVRAVYEEEPTVATRVVMVDRCGDKYGPGNPLPIAFDGTIAVGNVTIQDDDGQELEINPDGSINVVSSTGGADTPTLVNFSIALANTEYSYVLPTGTKQFSIKDRAGDAKTRIAYVSGDTGATWKTLDMGCTYEVVGLSTLAGFTVYFRSNKAGRTLEILSWT